MFVSVWIDRHLNFGERTTNRVESQHAKLKKYLCVKNSSLDKFVSCIDQILKSQLTSIYESFEKGRIVLKHRHNLPCFKLLRGFVALEALDILEGELQQSSECIPLDSIDVFWRKLDLSLSTSVENEDICCDDELLSSYDVYARVFTDGIDELCNSLCFSQSLTPAEHWMVMPMTGVLIANRFGVILNYLTKREEDYPMPAISAYWIRHRAPSTAG
ncbi:hypothetical protein J1N35_009946 [Gossypium stocksii]|uniref:Protein FAR1-RELATED SEQUENCE n=1 Tax=Gossypium stocksii TaxID=47602 RepID=A0A9D3W141_9ROSI|nr:hypothetical protein J1N35_009946 [Gossypium stocksii]